MPVDIHVKVEPGTEEEERKPDPELLRILDAMHDESSWGKASMNPVSPLETLKAGLHWPQDENVIEEFSVRINKELQKWQVNCRWCLPTALCRPGMQMVAISYMTDALMDEWKIEHPDDCLFEEEQDMTQVHGRFVLQVVILAPNEEVIMKLKEWMGEVAAAFWEEHVDDPTAHEGARQMYAMERQRRKAEAAGFFKEFERQWMARHAERLYEQQLERERSAWQAGGMASFATMASQGTSLGRTASL